MRISASHYPHVSDEKDIYTALLQFDGRKVLDLGCGAARQSLFIASAFPGTHVTGVEIDRAQHAKNLQAAVPDNFTFVYGGAEHIPAGDDKFDIVMMFKSLHHVPVEHMDRAFEEVFRVLHSGGHVYISEPVYEGDFNDIMRLFHDEETVRMAAFDALQRAVEKTLFTHCSQHFFAISRTFSGFGQFEREIIGASYNDVHLTSGVLATVRSMFEQHMGPDGAVLTSPMRVDLLRKP